MHSIFAKLNTKNNNFYGNNTYFRDIEVNFTKIAIHYAKIKNNSCGIEIYFWGKLKLIVTKL